MQQDQFLETLRFFLRMPHNATPVLEHFAAMPNAQFHDFGGEERFVYIPATREKPVLLVAHADTACKTDCPTELFEREDIIRNADPEQILGADDRAGCAMVSILGPMLGHGILIMDGEESKGIGANALMKRCGTIAEEIKQKYQFMVEIDNPKSRNFVCYNIDVDGFQDYVAAKTGYRKDSRRAFTDIRVLAKDIYGVNLAAGYYKEHSPGEYLKKSAWLDALNTAAKWLGESDLPKFQLSEAAAAARDAFERGFAHLGNDEDDSAIKEFSETIRLAPNHADAYYFRSAAHCAKGKHDENIDDCTAAIKIDPDFAEAFHGRGISWHEKGEYDKAISDHSEAIRLRPNYAEAHYGRGEAHDEKGDHDKAIKDYSEAVRFDPEMEIAYYCRGYIYCHIKNDFDKAICDCTEAIRIDPEYVNAYHLRGDARSANEEYGKAISDYTEVIRLKPDCDVAYNNRGNAYHDTGDYDKAISDYAEAIRIDPNYANAYYGRGSAHYLKDECDKAVSDLTEAIKLAPERDYAYYVRGLVHRELEQNDKAIADFKESLRLNPEDEDAKEALRELQEQEGGG